MKDGELEPTYVTKREELKKLVTSIIRPKIVQGKSMNGKEFVSFLEQVMCILLSRIYLLVTSLFTSGSTNN